MTWVFRLTDEINAAKISYLREVRARALQQRLCA